MSQPDLPYPCEAWQDEACCTPASVQMMVTNQLMPLDTPSATCWPLLVARKCTEICDPQATTWELVGAVPKRFWKESTKVYVIM